MSIRRKYEERWNNAKTDEERAALREEIFAELTDKQLELMFVTAVARDNDVASERLLAALKKRGIKE